MKCKANIRKIFPKKASNKKQFVKGVIMSFILWFVGALLGVVPLCYQKWHFPSCSEMGVTFINRLLRDISFTYAFVAALAILTIQIILSSYENKLESGLLDFLLTVSSIISIMLVIIYTGAINMTEAQIEAVLHNHKLPGNISITNILAIILVSVTAMSINLTHQVVMNKRSNVRRIGT